MIKINLLTYLRQSIQRNKKEFKNGEFRDKTKKIKKGLTRAVGGLYSIKEIWCFVLPFHNYAHKI